MAKLSVESLLNPDLTEPQLGKQFVDLLKLWNKNRPVSQHVLVSYSHAVKNQRGRWISATGGHVGYPDLTIVNPNKGIWFIELKRKPNKPTEGQLQWLQSINNTELDDRLVAKLVWVPEELPDLYHEITD